jgi:hypothetical protein
MPINQGASNKIAYYPSTGDTIDDTNILYYNNNTNELTHGGRTSFIRNTYENRGNALLNTLQYHTNNLAMPVFFTRGRGSHFSPTSVQENDQIGQLAFAGFAGDNSTRSIGAYITVDVDGTVTTSNVPMRLSVRLLEDDGTYKDRLDVRRDRLGLSTPVVTSVGDITPNFDINGTGTVTSADALSYSKMGGEGGPTAANDLNSRAWIKGSWNESAISYGGLFVVEGNSIDALKAAVNASTIGFGDGILLGNITTSTGYFSSGLHINGASVSIRAKDTQNVSSPIEIKLASSTDGSGSFIVTGGLKATGEITSSYSDQRLKKDITPITGALDKIMSISGYSFRSNEKAAELGVGSAEVQIGLIAQEVEAVLPELVTNSAIEGYKTVRYDKLVSVLVNAIKEQQQMIDELRQLVSGSPT